MFGSGAYKDRVGPLLIYCCLDWFYLNIVALKRKLCLNVKPFDSLKSSGRSYFIRTNRGTKPYYEASWIEATPWHYVRTKRLCSVFGCFLFSPTPWHIVRTKRFRSVFRCFLFSPKWSKTERLHLMFGSKVQMDFYVRKACTRAR